MDCFEVLGVPSTSTQDEIKAKWRSLCRIHHPDRGGNPVDFDTFRRAYNEAMEKSKSPLTCPYCFGSGKLEVVRGFAAMKVMCRNCSGKGKIERVQTNKESS